MKVEIGEYVRTFNGEIAKIIGTDIEFNCKVYKTDQYIQSSRDFYVFENDSGIVKHSKNIIDLIEIGDYVNGKYVYKNGTDFGGEKCLHMESSEVYACEDFIYEDDIKSIVTKEMMKSVEYRVE